MTGPRGRIAWGCDACGAPVADGEGYLHVSYGGIRRREAARAEWGAHPGPVYPAGVLVACPSPVAWEVHHTRCDPRPDGHDYWIAVERIRTGADVIEWSAHLLEKNWLGQTNWRALLWRTHRSMTAA